MAPRASLAFIFLLGGCFPSGEGVDPPTDRTVYFPVGLALDADASHLFIANSDFDLQYNAGTVESWDLVALRDLLPRGCRADDQCDTDTEVCDTSSELGRVPSYWCVTRGPAASDVTSDPEHALAGPACGKIGELSAAERQLIPGRCRWILPQQRFTNPFHPEHGVVHRASVRIGAFATDVVYRARPAAAPASARTGRLFVPVRGDATLHWIDVQDDGALECGQNEPGQDSACADDHRRGNNPAAENTRGDSLLPEPFGIDADRDASFVMITNQTSSALGLFQNAWTEGGGLDNGPTYQFTLQFSSGQPMGLGAVPTPWADIAAGRTGGPDFITSFRGAAVLELVRVYPDTNSSPPRPYAKAIESVRILANANGGDSRGLALDATLRRTEELRCAARYGIDEACAIDPACAGAVGSDYQQCLEQAGAVPLDVLVTNRLPASLLAGQTQRQTIEQPGSLDLPAIQVAIALGYGPARVVVGNVTTASGARERRAFAVCFDSRRVVVYDPDRQRIETEILTGRGPQAFVVDEENALAYVAHFTDSYIGVVDLDQRHLRTYGSIIGSVERPIAPRSSK
jgi:hypothetical protein